MASLSAGVAARGSPSEATESAPSNWPSMNIGTVTFERVPTRSRLSRSSSDGNSSTSSTTTIAPPRNWLSSQGKWARAEYADSRSGVS